MPLCSSSSSSSSPFPSSAKSGVVPSAPDQRRRRICYHLAPNCCCWVAFDIRSNFVHYAAIFEDEIEPTKAVEPKLFAKSVVKSFQTFRQKQSQWRISDLAVIFGYVRARISQQCAVVDEPSNNGGCSTSSSPTPPTPVPIKVVIVVPTKCSLPFQISVEDAAEAAGFAEVHLLCRATALAISYRLLFLDDDDSNNAARISRQLINRTMEKGREQTHAASIAQQLIIQLDEDDDNSANNCEGVDKFVAILYVCEHCIELTIFDFQPHHLPLLISSKMLFLTDPASQIDLINKFFRRHFTAFRANLCKLLTAGDPKLIAFVMPTIKKHIASSCKLLLSKGTAAVPLDMLAIFGASVKAVHLMLSKESSNQCPLFLARAMVPDFDYVAAVDKNGHSDGVDDAEFDAQLQKVEAEVAAIDESFNETFGLRKQTPNTEEQIMEDDEPKKNPGTSLQNEDIITFVNQDIGTTKCHNVSSVTVLDDILLPAGEKQQRLGPRKQLTDDEKQQLADVIINFACLPGTTTCEAECQAAAALMREKSAHLAPHHAAAHVTPNCTAPAMQQHHAAIATASPIDGSTLSSRCAAAEVSNNSNRMRWEETDDEVEEATQAQHLRDQEEEEDDEIATLGEDDRSAIVGEPSLGLSSHSVSPSVTSSPRDTVEENGYGDDDDTAETLDGDETPPVLNTWGQPVTNADQWTHANYGDIRHRCPSARRGRTSQKGHRWTAAPPPLSAMQRPSSRATTIMATSDDDEKGEETPAAGLTRDAKRSAEEEDVEVDDLLLPIFGPQRPLAGKFGNDIEQQFYLRLPTDGQGPLSSVQVLGLPLQWISNKFFQQEFKEWMRIRSGLRRSALISCFVTFSCSAAGAFRICRVGRFSNCPFNGAHNGLIVYALLPTQEVAWHVCWACNQFDDNLGNYWPTKYGQLKFKPTMSLAGRQTFLEE